MIRLPYAGSMKVTIQARNGFITALCMEGDQPSIKGEKVCLSLSLSEHDRSNDNHMCVCVCVRRDEGKDRRKTGARTGRQKPGVTDGQLPICAHTKSNSLQLTVMYK